jgi:hypothetical protein
MSVGALQNYLIEASSQTLKLPASVNLDESITKYRILTGVMDAFCLHLMLRRKHSKSGCHLIGPDENERHFASAFSLLVGPDARALTCTPVNQSSVYGALLANSFALVSRAVSQKHQPALRARLNSLSLAARLLADDRPLPRRSSRNWPTGFAYHRDGFPSTPTPLVNSASITNPTNTSSTNMKHVPPVSTGARPQGPAPNSSLQPTPPAV